jgi:antitoxin component of MazEF toxin-antitoxin module
MNRKLIKQGGTGLTLYVPKKWVDRLKLKPGDEVSIEEDGNKLILSPESVLKDKLITIDVTNMDTSSLRIALSSVYWQGYNKIKLTTKKKFSFVIINRLIDSYMGLIITEQSDKNIIIQNTATEKFEDIDKIINKLFTIIKYMFTKVNEKDELLELRKSTLKLGNYCQRLVFTTNFGKDKTYEYSSLILMLKKISGSLTFLIKNNKEVLELFNELNNAYLKKDLSLATKTFEEIFEKRKKIFKKDNEAVLGSLLENMYSLSSRIVSVLV